jgi:hypothetical protein
VVFDGGAEAVSGGNGAHAGVFAIFMGAKLRFLAWGRPRFDGNFYRRIPQWIAASATQFSMTNINLNASISEQASASDSAEAQQISNFAWQHLEAARTFSARSLALERDALGQDFGDFFVDIRSHVSVSILSAVASLEALINEFFLAPHCPLRHLLDDFEKDFWGEKGIERKPILEKYQTALTKLKLERLDSASSSYVNALCLIELRNSLIHYKPNWDPDRDSKTRLIKKLKGKYALSPFFGSQADFLTMQSMSAGCAIWAVDSVLKFLRTFDAIAKIDPDKMAAFWQLESKILLQTQ